MKRGWFGLGLLVFLLLGGLLVTGYMGRGHREISRELEQAAAHALAGDWEEALEEAREAREDWEEGWHFSAAFADHEPMEEMDTLFAQLPIYYETDSPLNFAAVCSDLTLLIQAIGENQALKWWGVL